MAELADALASGASSRKGVEVRVLSWAPFEGDAVYIPAAQAATQQCVEDLINGSTQDASAYLYTPSTGCIEDFSV